MPDNNYPPFATDTGALIIPRQLDRWIDINPQGGALRRCQTYITLPAFSRAVAWRGYSDIVAAFNYSSPNNFSLKTFTAPTSPNYTLCISYTNSDKTVVRYKLWAAISGEEIPWEIPLYANQPIKKNFRLEVWSTNVASVIQTSSVNLYTSVLQNIDYRFGSDTSLISPSTICTAQQISTNTVYTVAPPTSNVSEWFTSDSGLTLDIDSLVISWDASIGGDTLLPTGFNRPAYSPSASNRPDGIQITKDNTLSLSGTSINVEEMFILGEVGYSESGDLLITFDGASSFTIDYSSLGSLTFTAGVYPADFIDFPEGHPLIFNVVNGTPSIAYVYDALTLVQIGYVELSYTFNFNFTGLTLGDTGNSNDFLFTVYDILMYTSTLSSANRALVLQYFHNKFGRNQWTLPMTNAVCVQPVTN